MAIRTKYGKTPWGAEWLQSLEKVDFSNRLPRGRSYANRGMVSSIDIHGTRVIAKVKGSRPRPYSVDIKIPELPENIKAALGEKLEQEKLWQVALGNQQFAPEFLKWLKEIQGVFPKRWNDWHMGCSCPDWAVPCKHLASVIYALSQEIDRNPFLLFSLVGVDLNLKQAEESFDFFEQWSDFYGGTTSESHEALNKLDLSAIQTQGLDLLQMLAEAPPFYGKDFHKELTLFYKGLKRYPVYDLFEGAEDDPIFSTLKTVGNIQLTLDDKAEFFKLASSKSKRFTALPFDAKALLNFLSSLTPSDLPMFHPKIQWMQQAFSLAQHLVQQQLVRPSLWQAKKGFHILWAPISTEPAVEKALKQLEGAMPDGLIQLSSKTISNKLSEEGKLHALMIFLVEQLLATKLDESVVADHQALDHLFYRKKEVTFERIEDQSIPQAIALWLRPWQGLKKTHHYLLELVDQPSHIRASLKVAELGNKQEAIPLVEALKSDLPLKVLQDLEWLHRRWVPLGQLWRKDHVLLNYDPLELKDLLLQILPELQRLGMELRLDKALRSVVRPAISMRVDSSSDRVQSFFSMKELFEFDWKMALGDQLVDPAEFLKKALQLEGVVRIKDQYVMIDPTEIAKIQKRFEKLKDPKPMELIQIALSGEFEGTKIERTDTLMRLLENLRQQQSVDHPQGLLAELRPYQIEGYHWLYRNAKMGVGSILADDMGLGKTLQAISFLLKLKEEGHLSAKQAALIVLPTGLLTNWAHELQRFAPSLMFDTFHGQQRQINENVELTLTSYGMLRNQTAIFKKKKWQVMIIDEAQAIKNSTTAQSKAVRSVSAQMKIALSGTPVENSLTEYWSIMDYTNKGYLGALTAFKKNFVKPIELKQDEKQLHTFREITAPFIKRRLKTDKTVIADLPEKIEEDRYVNLTTEQSSLYEAVLNENLRQIREADGIQRKGMVLKMITALKQICNHPAQYHKESEIDHQFSGKAEALLPLIKEVISRGEKIIIFTQYRTAGDLIQQWIEKEVGLKAEFLHGGCSRKDRDEMVDQFQNNPDHRILLLSLKAAGTGLNLVAASHVVHFDLWWNPAVESQATDRAFRIGQKKNVMVHRLICSGTFEEKINEMINNKKGLADKVMEGNSQKWLGEMSNQELDAFFQLER
ncbi:DEAD/DEAH box helicase [Persicobacter psychrovividus]|uniref:Helicase n=1 Tax=Persicobacter psychrovividus TaxID=387638 RepID=A0ABM7VMH2_9BACT|nr:helicase [Persicobacter psychrovividus]